MTRSYRKPDQRSGLSKLVPTLLFLSIPLVLFTIAGVVIYLNWDSIKKWYEKIMRPKTDPIVYVDQSNSDTGLTAEQTREVDLSVKNSAEKSAKLGIQLGDFVEMSSVMINDGTTTPLWHIRYTIAWISSDGSTVKIDSANVVNGQVSTLNSRETVRLSDIQKRLQNVKSQMANAEMMRDNLIKSLGGKPLPPPKKFSQNYEIESFAIPCQVEQVSVSFNDQLGQQTTVMETWSSTDELIGLTTGGLTMMRNSTTSFSPIPGTKEGISVTVSDATFISKYRRNGKLGQKQLPNTPSNVAKVDPVSNKEEPSKKDEPPKKTGPTVYVDPKKLDPKGKTPDSDIMPKSGIWIWRWDETPNGELKNFGTQRWLFEVKDNSFTARLLDSKGQQTFDWLVTGKVYPGRNPVISVVQTGPFKEVNIFTGKANTPGKFQGFFVTNLGGSGDWSLTLER